MCHSESRDPTPFSLANIFENLYEVVAWLLQR
jgi:hypothetical protein